MPHRATLSDMATVGAAKPNTALEVRPVGPEAFEDVYPLLQLFPTKRMSRADWYYTILGYPWSEKPERGHALYADGRPVGFIGTVVSERPIAGRLEKFCNPSSFIVLEEYRYAALLLLRALQRMRDHTMVYLTPSPAAHAMFVKQGALPLEEQQIVTPPLPHPLTALRHLGGSFTTRPEALREELEGDERRIYEDHASSPVARHVLLRHGDRRCYVVATRGVKRGIPYADVQYIGNRAFFWEHHLLAQLGLVRAMGTAGLAMAVDCRFLVGRAPPLSIRWKARRLYRPTRPEIAPAMIDGLYSEMMGLRF